MTKMKTKNDGFKYPEISEKDYFFGAERSAPFEVINPSGDWTSTLPVAEAQRNDNGDTNGCTNFGTTSQVEVLLDFLFKEEDNFSERFQAVVSGQERNGNDPQKVYESIRLLGMLPDRDLPYTDDMSFEAYLSPKPMTSNFLKKAKLFLDTYEFSHEYIYHPYDFSISPEEKRTLLLQALKRSPVGVSVYAWVGKDVYTKPTGVKDNHWTVLVNAKEGEYWEVFDSYPPHCKRLKWDDPWFDIAKGIHIALRTKKPSLVERLIQWIINLLKK